MELLLFFVDELVMSGFPELLGVSITLIKLVVEYLFLLIETHHLVRIPVARIEYRPIIPIEQTNGLGEHIIDLLDYNIIIITIIMICVIIWLVPAFVIGEAFHVSSSLLLLTVLGLIFALAFASTLVSTACWLLGLKLGASDIFVEDLYNHGLLARDVGVELIMGIVVSERVSHFLPHLILMR